MWFRRVVGQIDKSVSIEEQIRYVMAPACDVDTGHDGFD